MPFDFLGGIMFTIVPLIVIGGFLFVIIKGITQWSHNNAQPVLSVWAKVVAKRTNVSHSTTHDQDNIAHSSSSTTYYATFEVESGDRIEFHVKGSEYGMLVEGDTGKLTFQGTRYLEFNRGVSQ